jgi:hydrogenase maturation factor HypF (carbamoyltransferase family)
VQFGINLLEKKEIASKEEKEVFSKVKRILVVTLLIYAFLVVSLIGIQFFLSREKQNLASQESQLESKIKTFQKAETLEVLIKDRLGKCTKIISTRTHPEEILTKIINAKEEGVEIIGVELAKNEEVKMVAESSDVASLESFTDKIKKVFQDEGFQTIILETVTRTKAGGYNIGLTAQK